MTNTEITAAKLANIDRAAADRGLSNLDFRLLWLLSSAADSKTGVARRKQNDLAEKLDIHRRTVQRSRDRLVILGYLKPIGQKPGGYVSGYNVVMSKKAAPVSPFEKGGVGAAFDGDKAALVPPIGGAGVPKRRSANRTNLSLSSPFKNLPCMPDSETENRGASPRLEGARPAPLGKLEPELRQRLGERFGWLNTARLLPSDDARVVRLSVLTEYQRDQIRQKCEADILAVAGASKLDFTVEIISAEPARARRAEL